MSLEREVIIVTKIEPHDGNKAAVKSMLDALIKLQKDAVDRMKQNTVNVAGAAASAVENMAKSASANMKAMFGDAAAGISATAKQAKAAMDAIGKSQAELKNITIDFGMSAAESFAKTTTGIMSVGRGFAILAYSGGENLQKVLQKLIKIQAYFDVARGFVDVITAQVKAYRDLNAMLEKTAAIKATIAAAEVAGAATQTASAATQTASAGGGVTQDVAAGVAGSSIFTWIAKHLKSAFGAIITALKFVGSAILAFIWPITIAVGIFVGIVATLTYFSPKFKEGLYEWLGWTDRAGDAMKKSAEMHERRAEAEKQATTAIKQWSAHRQEYYSLGLGGGDSVQKKLATAAMHNRLGYGMQSNGAAGMYQNRIQGAKLELDAYQEMRDIRKEDKRLAIESYRERVKGAQEHLKVTKQNYDTKLKEIQALKNQYQSGKERFGSMSSYDQARTIQAKQAADRGERLGNSQMELLSRLGLIDTTRAVSKEKSTRADEGGYGKHFGGGEIQSVTQANQDARDMLRTLRRGITVDTNVRVILGSDVDTVTNVFARKLERQMRPVFIEIDRRIEAAFSRRLETEATLRRQKERADEGTKGLAAT